MLPRENRLKKRNDFQYILKRGAFFSTKNLRLRVCVGKSDHIRIGFIIGKNVCKTAVARNRARRIARHIVGVILQELQGKKDMVVTLGPALIREPTEVLEKEFRLLFTKANLLKTK